MKICVQLCLLLAATATIVGFAEAKDKVIAVKGEKEFASLIKVWLRHDQPVSYFL
jgi:hypothetical protein